MTDPLARLAAALADRYRIERELGAGGMATVYLAQDLKHDRHVAIKVLRPDLAAALGPERFLREVKIAANLQHPHILPLHDSGEADGFLFYVMPFVDGVSLREKLVREGELPIPDAVRILRDVADAMAYAHSQGVVHRDIKPENIMLSGRHALVTDFGVAKAVSEATGTHALTTVGVALGTPAYMAPEQAAADPHVDHRADIYAFGVVAYELLTGQPPFTAATPQALLSAQVTMTPQPVTAHRPSIPPALAGLVMKCLEKKPADRYQSADELIPQLEAVLTPSGGMTPTDTRPLRARWRAGVIAVGAVAAVAVGGWLWRGRPGSVPAASAVHTIAVISLTAANADTAQEYFSDGITDELTTALAQVPGLAVINRGSAAQFKGASVNPREVASKLRVDHIVELRVRRSGTTVRVDADLVNCATEVAVWSHGYRGELGGLQAMQDEISGAIAGALRVRTAGPPRQPRREPSPEAFEAYLRGRSILNGATTKAEYDRGQEYLARAMAADRAFAEPYAAAALWYQLGAGIADPFLEAYTKAEGLSRRAIQLDDENAEAHVALGWAAAVLRWDWAEAQRELERALALNPNGAQAHFYYGLFWNAHGQLPRALDAFRKAVRLDPTSPLGGWLEVFVWVGLGQPDSAVAAQRRADEVNPGFFLGDAPVSGAYRQKGMLDTALALDRAASTHEQHPTPGLVFSLVALGRRAEAQAAYRGMVEASRRAILVPETLAAAAFALGDRDGALTWLEKGVDMHSDLAYWFVPVYPELRPLLADPRYQRLLDRMHLPH